MELSKLVGIEIVQLGQTCLRPEVAGSRVSLPLSPYLMAFAPSFSPSDFAPPGFGAPNYPPLGEIKNDLKSWHALKSRQRDIFELMEMEGGRYSKRSAPTILMYTLVPGSESCLRDRACEISLRIHQLEHGLMGTFRVMRDLMIRSSVHRHRAGIDTPYTITALARAEQSIKELSNKLTQGVEQITKVEERIAAIEERLTTMDILQRQDRARVSPLDMCSLYPVKF